MYTFKDMIGQKEIIKHIQNAIEKDRIAHAYIIDGQKGMGKMTVAMTFAKALQCEQTMNAPCDTCVSCRAFDSGNHPDVIMVSPSKKKGIGVDDIREQINKDINIKPYQYTYKIYIIDNADTMTEQAQNALLKTMEEPPAYARILLLSNNKNKFLPTILSRCVILTLKPIADNEMLKYIINELHIPGSQADLYVSFSQGRIGRVHELVNTSTFLDMREACIQVIQQLFDSDMYQIFNSQKALESFKEVFDEVIELFISWFRDLFIIKSLNSKQYLIHKDKYNLLFQQAKRLSYDKIGNILEELVKTKNKLNYNVNFQLLVEMLLIHIKNNITL